VTPEPGVAKVRHEVYVWQWLPPVPPIENGNMWTMTTAGDDAIGCRVINATLRLLQFPSEAVEVE
jgi:hypothetical protein